MLQLRVLGPRTSLLGSAWRVNYSNEKAYCLQIWRWMDYLGLLCLDSLIIRGLFAFEIAHSHSGPPLIIWIDFAWLPIGSFM